MKQTINIEALKHEPINKLLKQLAIPASLAMFVSALYNIVDTIFVGRLIGWQAIAALTIANPLQMILLAIGQTFGIGAASIISRALGAGDNDKANKSLGNSLISILAISIITAVLGTTFIIPILKLFGASSDILPYAYDYMMVIMPLSIFRMAGPGMNNIVRAEGNANLAMRAMIIGAITNIFLDPILIYFLDMGIRGAAIATVFSQALSAVYVLVYLVGPYGSLRVTMKCFIPDFNLLKEIVTIGVPSFFRQAGTSILTIVLNKLLGIYGDIFISIYGVILKLSSFTFMPALGIFQGMQPILGYNYGAKDYVRVKEVISLARKWALVFIISSTLIIEIFPEFVISIFSTDQQLIENGINLIRIFFIAFWLTPFNIASSNTFQSIGNGSLALLSALLRQFIILIPVLLLSHYFFGLIGIFIAFPISDTLSSIISHYLLNRELGKLPTEVQYE